MPTADLLQTVNSAPVPADPKPITAALQRHFDEVLSRIPSGRRGVAEAAVTTQGIEGSVGASIQTEVGVFTGTVYGGREWTGGWLAGAKTSWVF